MAQGDGKKLKEQMHQRPRPTVTDGQWQDFKAMSAAEKGRALAAKDQYYEGIRRRWQEESGLGVASAAAWLRQLSLWQGEANAAYTAMIAAKGLD